MSGGGGVWVVFFPFSFLFCIAINHCYLFRLSCPAISIWHIVVIAVALIFLL
jgi:hypothetical protein